MVKQMQQLNSERTTTEDEFRKFFTNAMTHYKQIQQTGLASRLEIQHLLTEQEGKQIIKASVVSWKKRDKKREKLIIKLIQRFEKLNSKIDKQIEDEKRQGQAIEIIDKFTNTLMDIKREYDRFNLVDNSILKKHDASKSELQTVLDKKNELRWQFYNAYIETHDKLVKVTTEEEWDQVIKSVNRIF